MGTVRLEEYLRNGRTGRVFWRVAGGITTLVTIALAVVMLALPWHHPDASADSPAWWTWSIGLPVGSGFGWLAALLLAGVRAMHRHRADPGVDDDHGHSAA